MHRRFIMPAVILIAGPLGNAVRQVLLLLGVEVAAMDVTDGLPSERAGVAQLARGLKDMGAGQILVSTRSATGATVCEDLRASGALNPILDLAGRTGLEAKGFSIEPWDGRLATLLRCCLDPVFVSAENLSVTCRPIVERRLRHDLPKLIRRIPELGDAELVAHVCERIHGRALLEVQLKSFVEGFVDSASAGAALREILERR